MIRYLEGCGPTDAGRRSRGAGRLWVETRIWRPGDVGWVAEIIELAWSRWLAHYPEEWRTVGQAIPYIHLKSELMCDRPWKKVDVPPHLQHVRYLEDLDIHLATLAAWERSGKVGPTPRLGDHAALGHTHAHDHGICLDPSSLEDESDNALLARVLKHELAHAIAGSFGHGEEWISMCRIIGYEPDPHEKDRDARHVPTDADPYEDLP